MRIQNEKPLSVVRKEQQAQAQEKANIKKVPILESDVQEVAEMTSYVLLDTTAVAELAAILLEDTTASGEVLAMALEKIVELESRIGQLEGGN